MDLTGYRQRETTEPSSVCVLFDIFQPPWGWLSPGGFCPVTAESSAHCGGDACLARGEPRASIIQEGSEQTCETADRPMEIQGFLRVEQNPAGRKVRPAGVVSGVATFGCSGRRPYLLAGPLSGHPPGPLLKALSRLASLEVVVLSHESSAALTSAMTWAVVSG